MNNRELAIKIYNKLNAGGAELGNYAVSIIMDTIDASTPDRAPVEELAWATRQLLGEYIAVRYPRKRKIPVDPALIRANHAIEIAESWIKQQKGENT